MATNTYRGWTQIEYQNKHYNINQKDEGTYDDRGRDGETNFTLRIKEQETRLTLHEHEDERNAVESLERLEDVKHTDVFTLHTRRACTLRVPWKKVHPKTAYDAGLGTALSSYHSKTDRWLLVWRFWTFCYERRKVSRTKQFGMHTHRIYTGNSGGCGYSVAIIHPNYMQPIYSTHTHTHTHRPGTRNSVVILSPRG